MEPYDSSNGLLPPDPSHAFGPATQSLWNAQIEGNVMPVIRRTVREPWDGLMRNAPVAVRRTYEDDPIVQDYLRDAQNRLTNFPDELYARTQRTISYGLGVGRSIQDVAEEVRGDLIATGNNSYRNRAETVARTETIGATNAGAYASSVAMSEVIGEEDPEKVWLATDDSRTRHSHREADGQRVPLSSPFTVGGFNLTFPGDPSGPPQEVINCRCTILSVALGEELDWTNRQYTDTADDLWADYDQENDNG